MHSIIRVELNIVVISCVMIYHRSIPFDSIYNIEIEMIYIICFCYILLFVYLSLIKFPPLIRVVRPLNNQSFRWFVHLPY